jgi:protein CWC15
LLIYVTGNSDEDDVDSDDEEDDPEELQREVERIKQERAEAAKAAEEARRTEEEQERLDNIRRGNPLLDLDGLGSAKVKRRWNDDVVFRNQARSEPEKKKRFVNDTIRNDFHRRFLSKYMK